MKRFILVTSFFLLISSSAFSDAFDLFSIPSLIEPNARPVFFTLAELPVMQSPSYKLNESARSDIRYANIKQQQSEEEKAVNVALFTMNLIRCFTLTPQERERANPGFRYQDPEHPILYRVPNPYEIKNPLGPDWQ